MKRTVLVFGLISGAISSAMMFLYLPLINRGVINHDNGEVIGYTSIFLSFLLVFFGIRSYRESHGGTITFGRGVAVGILITLVSCVFYVASWEILYYKFMPDFGDKYAVHVVEKMRAKGASEQDIAAKKKQLEQFKAIWENPFLNAAMTFIEPFPVGLIVTLVSAGILRRRKAPPELAVA
ncbi:MAG TPA: DUF4199 domain-containing protein [Thermoanaerobaculia bacterium]|jgi:hypothetical protein